MTVLCPLPPTLALLFNLMAFAPPSTHAQTARDEPRTMSPLRVGANHRFLVTEEGRPFFWLGDTAWRLSVLTPDEVDAYMENRVRHAFNVIQVHPGFEHPDHAGHPPFLDGDPDRPNEPFWRHIDDILAKARAHGLYVALVPMWGQEYAKVFQGDAEKARAFGRWIGRRYAAQSHIVWIASGEYDGINNFRLPIRAEQKAVVNAAAEGLRDAHHGTQLMTIHPGVVRTSSRDFHRESWLDFNMLQSGHMIDCGVYKQPENHALIAHDYRLTPTKPVLDGEPIYEDTPDGVWTVKNTDGPRADAAAVRRKAYWGVFAGGCGHTYGHNDVYPFCDPAHPRRSSKLPQGPGPHDWRTAIDAEGAAQMKHVRFLIESRPFLDSIPDPSLVVGAPTSGLDHVVASRAADGGYAMIYSPRGRPVTVALDKLSGDRLKVWWYNPRGGAAEPAGECDRLGVREFTPPTSGDGQDWVLVLDDAAKKYVAPGSHADQDDDH
jgi:NAD(P)-dependent dehydrogenase (short-subunit alcohol dehydrogenase family)